MSRRVRLGLFSLAGAGLAAVLLIGFDHLPDFGHAHELYGALNNRLEPTLRHATDIVTGLNFDIRAFDTLGEEFILFTSVTGVALLLRTLRDEKEQEQLTPGIEENRMNSSPSVSKARKSKFSDVTRSVAWRRLTPTPFRTWP